VTERTSPILIGQPRQRRTQLLQTALRARGLTATVVDWSELIRDPAAVAARLRAVPGHLVKLDSPGESDDLQHALIQHGWHSLGEPGTPPWALAHGEFAYQHFWYAGFADILRRLEDAAPGVHWLNAPREILRLCDKRTCQEHLIVAGIDTPPLLGPIDSYAQLRDRMRAEHIDRVFLKARFGSSAAGVVAYRTHRDGREVAYTSAELVRGRTGSMHSLGDRLFNSLRLRRYTAHVDIIALIDAIAAQSAYAETWVAKPRAVGHTKAHFDLRVVSLAGVPRQRIARIASQPMTNLHLGNRRGEAGRLIDEAAMRRVEDSVRRAAAVFPHCGMIGFDLIPVAHRTVVLEANAFGDLLPGLHWHNASTYDDQAAWFAKLANAHRARESDDTCSDEAAAHV
jgi:hypothetical protein